MAPEDALALTDDFVAVVDGATSKGTMLWDGMTSGRKAAMMLSALIAELKPDTTCAEFISKATDLFAGEYRNHGVTDLVREEPCERLTASVAVYSARRKEVWLVGDCMCLSGGRQYHFVKPVDVLFADVRAECDSWLLAHGHTEDELASDDMGRKVILPLLREQCYFQNPATPSHSPYDYCAIDGFPLPQGDSLAPAAQPHVIDCKDSDEVVLSSDGYPRLFPTLSQSEEYLGRMLAVDPLSIGVNRQTKGRARGAFSYDDRTYVRIGRREIKKM